MKSFDNINIAALEAVSVRKLPDIVENDADGVKNAIYEPVAKMAEQVNAAFGTISNNFVEHETKVNAAQLAVVTAQTAADTAKNIADSKSIVQINNVKSNVDFKSDPQVQITSNKIICDNLYNNNIYNGRAFRLDVNGLYIIRPHAGGSLFTLKYSSGATITQDGNAAGYLISGIAYAYFVTNLTTSVTTYWYSGSYIDITRDGNFVVYRLSNGIGL